MTLELKLTGSLALTLLTAWILLVRCGDGQDTAATTPAANVTTVSISLGLIWDSQEAVDNLTSMSPDMLSVINSSCPNSTRVRSTVFNIAAFPVNSLPTNDELKSVVGGLSAGNYLFFGVMQNSVTQVIESLVAPTSLAELPLMQRHVIAPLPQSMLLDALLKVIQQRVGESQFPTDVSNFRGALFMDNSVSASDLYPLFTYFKEGFVYFKYNLATVEANLLTVRHAQITNIVVIMLNATQGRVLRNVAFRLNMFTSRYRWFLHGPRLINDGSDPAMNIISKNVTSIEFGRVMDSLAKRIWSTTGIFVYDLLSIWQPFLTSYLCKQRPPDPPGFPSVKGFTGRFQLNSDGSATRANWQLAIYSGLGSYREQIGQWSSDTGFDMLVRKDTPRDRDRVLADLKANVFRIVTAISPPYVQYREGVLNCSSATNCNDELTGMYLETCKMVLENLGITNYEIFLQPDNAVGVFNGSSWNGVLRTVMDGKAMLGCIPVTINTDRYQIVDFTQVIHNSRMSLLLKTYTVDSVTQAFQFIMPLSYPIWLSVLAALVLVALCLFLMNKIAPNTDANYNLYNSLFFAFAEVVQGTSGTTPSRISGRIVVTFFWFFTLFLFLSYMANYAVFRTLDGVKQEVTSIDTLIENRGYDCGSIANYVTDSLLNSSAYLNMQQIYLLMKESFSNGSVASVEAALSLINDPTRRYKFVLINDNLQNQYYSQMGCDLTSTGEFYDLKNAMILPKGNDYASLIDEQLTSLTANITDLQKMFFAGSDTSPKSCYDGSFASALRYWTPKDAWTVKPGALTLSDTLGIAVINLLGCCIALILAGIERAVGRFQTGRITKRREQQKGKASEKKFQRPTE